MCTQATQRRRLDRPFQSHPSLFEARELGAFSQGQRKNGTPILHIMGLRSFHWHRHQRSPVWATCGMCWLARRRRSASGIGGRRCTSTDPEEGRQPLLVLRRGKQDDTLLRAARLPETLDFGLQNWRCGKERTPGESEYCYSIPVGRGGLLSFMSCQELGR
jgi:hypothetical protein